jgi:large subunit ribosomal protein L7/L12
MAEGNGRQWSDDIREIGDRIAALTVSKAVELGDYMEEVHGIKAAAGAAVMVAPGPGGPGGVAPEKPPEKTEFTVVLEGVPDQTKRVGVIKIIREITGLGLKESKDKVEGAPQNIKENVPKDEAEAIRKKLEDAGAKVSVK